MSALSSTGLSVGIVTNRSLCRHCHQQVSLSALSSKSFSVGIVSKQVFLSALSSTNRSLCRHCHQLVSLSALSANRCFCRHCHQQTGLCVGTVMNIEQRTVQSKARSLCSGSSPSEPNAALLAAHCQSIDHCQGERRVECQLSLPVAACFCIPASPACNKETSSASGMSR